MSATRSSRKVYTCAFVVRAFVTALYCPARFCPARFCYCALLSARFCRRGSCSLLSGHRLGVYLYSHMSFDKHVSESCKASYFHIRALRHIRSSLTTEAAKTVAVAIIGSRLDYCNSLLAGTSASNLARLQLVQNTLARDVAQKSRYCHITPVLAGLHWLPVRHRINFKIATTAFQVLHHQQPLYTLLRFFQGTHLHDHFTSSSINISAPLRKTSMATSKSFSSTASQVWNKLPIHISSALTLPVFRRHLKHHLFLGAYWVSLHQPSKFIISHRPPNAFQPSAYD